MVSSLELIPRALLAAPGRSLAEELVHHERASAYRVGAADLMAQPIRLPLLSDGMRRIAPRAAHDVSLTEVHRRHD